MHLAYSYPQTVNNAGRPADYNLAVVGRCSRSHFIAAGGSWISASSWSTVHSNDCFQKLRLFSKVRHCAHHVLDELLPPKSDSQHNFRKRRHYNLTLPKKKGHLANSLATVGRRAFGYAGPKAWNSLPNYLRCGDLSLETFKRQLKTFLFAHY